MLNHGPYVSRLSRLALIGSLLSSVAVVPAMAQDAAPPGPDADAGVAGDIIVTATRRSESIQKVPISIQALSSETLSQHQVQSYDDYVKLLPSVTFNSAGPGQAQTYFRGINSGGDGLDVGSLPTTGTYLDDIPITTIGGNVDIHMYDINRVEALAGPQGTLFGASSLAGTLRIITNKPDPSKFSAGYDLGLNKFGPGSIGGTTEGFINLPINEKMAIRLVGYYEHDGGYIDNTYKQRTYQLDDADPNTKVIVDNAKYVGKNQNYVNTAGGRAALRIELDDDWTVTPQILYQKQWAHGSFLYDPNAGDLKVHDFLNSLNRDEWYQAGATIEGKLSNWDVVYSGGYMQRWKYTASDYSYYTVAYDHYSEAGGYAAKGNYYYYTKFPDGKGGFLDPTQNSFEKQRYTKMTHELRVSSPAGERLRATFGGFMQRQTNLIATDFAVQGVSEAGTTIADFPNPGLFPAAGFPDSIFTKRLRRVDRDYAMFAEGNYDILPNLTLTAGARVFIVKNSLLGYSGIGALSRNAARCVPTTDTFYPCISVNKNYQEAGETHKASLSWKITPEKMVYFTYSTGFRPGGNDRRPGTPSFLADTLTNYEVGWKTSWLGGKFRFNGAIFREDWSKIQFTLPGANGQNYLLNAPGGALVRGVESDMSFRTGGLSLSAAGAYIDSKLADDFCNANGCTPKGTRLPATPRLKMNANARYEWSMGEKTPFVQATVFHQGGTRAALLDTFVNPTVNYLGQTVNQFGYTKQFTTVDFSAGITFGNSTVQAYIQNAFDQRGILSKGAACGLAECREDARLYPTKPQLFGMRFGQKF